MQMKLNEIILAHQMDPNSNGMFMRGKAVANGFTHQHSGWCHCMGLISTLNQHKHKNPNALAFQTFQTFNVLQNSTVAYVELFPGWVCFHESKMVGVLATFICPCTALPE